MGGQETEAAGAKTIHSISVSEEDGSKEDTCDGQNTAIDNSNAMFTTYTMNPITKFTNNMQTYLPDAKEDDDVTIVTNNKTLEQETGACNKIIKYHPLYQSPHADTMFNT